MPHGGIARQDTNWHACPTLVCLHAHPLCAPLPIAARRLQVLMSGLEGELAAHLTRKLAQHGVASENIMFCDY